MSTPNYKTQNNFDLYVYEPEYSEADIIEYCNANNIIFSELSETDKQYIYDDMIQLDYDLTFQDLKYLINKFNTELIFHNIEIISGYYVGLQLYIETVENPENMDNSDCLYYFDCYKSQAIRKYKSEINKINKKILPYIHQNSPLYKIKCLGVFSNGEAIYRKVG